MKKSQILLLCCLVFQTSIAQPTPGPRVDSSKKPVPTKDKDTKGGGQYPYNLYTGDDVLVMGIKAPPFEELVVYRIQLRITIGTGTDAGTEDPIYVQMNALDKKFYLLKRWVNFREGKMLTYEILSDHIKTVRDIEFLRFGVHGDDGVCFKKIELLLNNNPTPFFEKMYPGSKGLCFDRGYASVMPLLEIHGSHLRSSGKWSYPVTAAGTPGPSSLWVPPTVISKSWFVTIVEATINSELKIYDQGVNWGSKSTGTIWGEPVEINKLDNHTLHIDLDLQFESWGPNSEVDMDFDMDFHCENGLISFDTENIKSEGGSHYGSGVRVPVKNAMATIQRFLFDKVNAAYAAPLNGCTKAIVVANGDLIIK